jgi:hypothetical protein
MPKGKRKSKKKKKIEKAKDVGDMRLLMVAEMRYVYATV